MSHADVNGSRPELPQRRPEVGLTSVFPEPYHDLHILYPSDHSSCSCTRTAWHSIIIACTRAYSFRALVSSVITRQDILELVAMAGYILVVVAPHQEHIGGSWSSDIGAHPTNRCCRAGAAAIYHEETQ